MSTKCTIDHGERWHLYEDAIDETVWLETRGFDFVAGLDMIRVHLPEEAIDAIRKARESNFPHLRTPNAAGQGRREATYSAPLGSPLDSPK